MTEDLEALERTVAKRYKTAMVFSAPLLAGFALLLLDSVWSIAVLPPPAVLGLIVFGLALGALPVTRYNRAKGAYLREVRKANLAAVAQAFEGDR